MAGARTDEAQLTDEHLVERVAAGDEQSLAALHDRHARLVLAVAHRIVRDEGAAHEVAQDAFLDVWRGAATYDPARASVVTWLVRFARLRAIDHARRSSAARRGGRGAIDRVVPLDEALDIACSADVAGAVEAGAQAQRVRTALRELPHDQRQVVALAFFGERTHTELAALLDLPVGTVKTRCFRGLQRLAELLTDEPTGVTP